MIGIIDYKLGNVGSVFNMLDKLGIKSKIICNPSDISSVDKLILPGVGSFDNGMKNLLDLKFLPEINEFVLNKKKPILGICLGMQLMCLNSEEGVLSGLGWIDASVVKFKKNIDGDIKIPHMGWNEVIYNSNTKLHEFINNFMRFYFVHSYFVNCNVSEYVILKCKLGNRVFDAAFEMENILGCQFHPEKSHKNGMKVLKYFSSI
jgi:glutamine amidotransferase